MYTILNLVEDINPEKAEYFGYKYQLTSFVKLDKSIITDQGFRFKKKEIKKVTSWYKFWDVPKNIIYSFVEFSHHEYKVNDERPLIFETWLWLDS